jgi:hypothetical protein
MDHPVWKIISKDKYTEEGQQELEQMFDNMNNILQKLDKDDIRQINKCMEEHTVELYSMLVAYLNQLYREEQGV